MFNDTHYQEALNHTETGLMHIICRNTRHFFLDLSFWYFVTGEDVAWEKRGPREQKRVDKYILSTYQ